MSTECWSILELSIRCRGSAQEVAQAYNASVLSNNFRVRVFFVFYLSQNWVRVRATAFARSDGTGVPFELSGWNFQHLSRIDWAAKLRWQRFFCYFSSHIWWQLRINLDQTIYELLSRNNNFYRSEHPWDLQPLPISSRNFRKMSS